MREARDLRFVGAQSSHRSRSRSRSRDREWNRAPSEVGPRNDPRRLSPPRPMSEQKEPDPRSAREEDRHRGPALFQRAGAVPLPGRDASDGRRGRDHDGDQARDAGRRGGDPRLMQTDSRQHNSAPTQRQERDPRDDRERDAIDMRSSRGEYDVRRSTPQQNSSTASNGHNTHTAARAHDSSHRHPHHSHAPSHSHPSPSSRSPPSAPSDRAVPLREYARQEQPPHIDRSADARAHDVSPPSTRQRDAVPYPRDQNPRSPSRHSNSHAPVTTAEVRGKREPSPRDAPAAGTKRPRENSGTSYEAEMRASGGGRPADTKGSEDRRPQKRDRAKTPPVAHRYAPELVPASSSPGRKQIYLTRPRAPAVSSIDVVASASDDGRSREAPSRRQFDASLAPASSMSNAHVVTTTAIGVRSFQAADGWQAIPSSGAFAVGFSDATVHPFDAPSSSSRGRIVHRSPDVAVTLPGEPNLSNGHGGRQIVLKGQQQQHQHPQNQQSRGQRRRRA